MIKTAITGQWRFAIYLLFFSLFVLINYFTERENFLQLIALYCCAFGIYILFLKYIIADNFVNETKFLGIFIRFALLFSMPNLTDDFYRFIWDGQLITHGINPYVITPTEFIQHNYLNKDFNGLNEQLYAQLNSKEYFTIYPPLSQCLFSIATILSIGPQNGIHNELMNIVILKLFIFLFEVGTILLIPKILKLLNLPATLQLIYVLNPLIIIELTGNLHFEAMMIFFLVFALYLLLKNNLTLSAIVFGFSIGAKLWPIMLLPLFFKYLSFRKALQYSIVSGVISVIVLLPMIIEYPNISRSLNLYFEQFEFNGSAYYFFRYLIGKEEHYETFIMMRKILPFITASCIFIYSALYKKTNLFNAMLLAFSIYCFFATTIHPWYLSPLIILTVFSNYRYAIVWSFLIYLSYITYSTPAYVENYNFIILEYVLVIGYFIYEAYMIKARRAIV